MTLPSFKRSVSLNEPPPDASVYLQALWYDAKNDWNKAHVLIQDMEDRTAAWIHAYLHRKEGEIWNADYWYNRAGKERPGISLQEEWERIVSALL